MKAINQRAAELVRHAAKAIGIPPQELLGKGVSGRKCEQISFARFVVWHQLWLEGHSYLSIAQAWEINHGTVMNGVRKISLIREITNSFDQNTKKP